MPAIVFTRLLFYARSSLWNLFLARNKYTPQEGRKHEATASFKGAMASLEKATQLGDRLLAPPPPSQQPADTSTVHTSLGGPVGSKTSPGRGGRGRKVAPDVVEATGEAMLRLAKLCEGLAAGKREGSGAGGELGSVGGRGREELAALAVKEYLRAMAVG